MTRRGTEMSTRRAVNIILTVALPIVVGGAISPVGLAIIVWWLTCTQLGLNVLALTALILVLWAAWPYLVPPLDEGRRERDPRDPDTSVR